MNFEDVVPWTYWNKFVHEQHIATHHNLPVPMKLSIKFLIPQRIHIVLEALHTVYQEIIVTGEYLF